MYGFIYGNKLIFELFGSDFPEMFVRTYPCGTELDPGHDETTSKMNELTRGITGKWIEAMEGRLPD